MIPWKNNRFNRISAVLAVLMAVLTCGNAAGAEAVGDANNQATAATATAAAGNKGKGETRSEAKALPLTNPGFEQQTAKDSIPGWTSIFASVEGAVSHEISKEEAYRGKHSLKITDTSRDHAVAVQSDPLTVEPGITYTGSVMMLLKSGSASLLFRYYDGSGKQVGDDMLQHISSGYGVWQKVQVSGKAPANAVTARIFASVNKYQMAEVYYDDFEVTYPKTSPGEPPAGEISFKGRTFAPPVDLGIPVFTVAINDAVAGVEDGRATMYSTAQGDTAVFSVVDIESNKLLRSFPLEGVHTVWRHTIAPDGTVYIAAIMTGSNRGELWSYSPRTKTVSSLGEPLPGEKSIWSLVTDDKGNVYGGTFQQGKVFKYDPAAKTYRDYGRMMGNQEYVRSMAYHNGYIYAGIGSTGAIVKLNVESGVKEVISGPVAELLGVNPADVPFAYDMAIVDRYLLVKFGDPQMALLFYDLERGEWLPHVVGKNIGGTQGAGVFSFNQLVTKDGKVYVPANGVITEIDLTTFEARMTSMRYGTSFRGAAWVEFRDDPGFPGQSFVTMQRDGKTSVFNVDAETSKTFPSVVQGSANPLHNMENGPDGNVYMSGYPGGIGVQFDPRTDTFKTFSLGQAEGIVAYGNDMYFGIYPGGHIYSLDTTQPVPQAKAVFQIGSEQDRPYVMRATDDFIMIGTIPDYGKLGGALTIYHPGTGQKEVYRDIVHNQSINGLAYKDGKIFGSTTVFGGLGIGPTEKTAKMFVWDVAKKEKVKEFTPDIPELDQPVMISGLTIGPDGNVWGGVDGVIFKLDPVTYRVLDYKNIYPHVKNYGFWRPYHPHWGQDGLLYIDLADRITVIDPQTLEHVTLSEDHGSTFQEIAFMTLAKDAQGNEHIYYIDEANVKKIQVTGHHR
ncbi:hypothetical protein FLT15_04375 [Paenibacillus thiaminolyticus]|nr:hypothetical protein [Paenibacillus thiaminolyticus]